MRHIQLWSLRLILVLLALVFLTLSVLRGLAALREGDASPPTQGRMIQTTLGAIHVEELGPNGGPPVLLVHGSVGWSRMWQPVQAMLADRGFRAIAFDMPPMGYSDRDPTGDYSRQRQAARITALARGLGIRPVLVAHSFGAGAAAEAAMVDPQQFSGLIVVSGAIGLNPDQSNATLPLYLQPQWVRELAVSATVTNPLATAPLLKSFLYRKDSVTPELVAMLQTPFRRQGSTTELARWLPTLLVPPTDARSTNPAGWAALSVPLALLWGDQDSVTPLAQGQTLADLTGAPLTVLPQVGHIPQIEAPDAFDRALIAALSALQAAP